MEINVALIDDHELVLQGMSNKLEMVDFLNIVGSYTEAQDLLPCLRYKNVDVVVMDLMLKGIHGFELLEQIKNIPNKEIKVIIISGFYEEILHKRSLELGAKAFLRKEISYDELISCIVSVAKGNNVIPDFLIENHNDAILSEMETKVLSLLISEFTNDQIAKELFISRRTVESHVSNICRKLEVNTRIGAVRQGIKLNLV